MQFIPTHKHIKTGEVYQNLGDVVLKSDPHEDWVGILYRNEKGNIFARTIGDFLEKFERLEERVDKDEATNNA